MRSLFLKSVNKLIEFWWVGVILLGGSVAAGGFWGIRDFVGVNLEIMAVSFGAAAVFAILIFLDGLLGNLQVLRGEFVKFVFTTDGG